MKDAIGNAAFAAGKERRVSGAPLFSHGLGWRLVFAGGLFALVTGFRIPSVALTISGFLAMPLAWLGLRTGRLWVGWILWAVAAFFVFQVTSVPSLSVAAALLVMGLVMAYRERKRLDTAPPEEAPLFRDERFDEPGNWEFLNEAEHFTQRFLRVNDFVLAETLMTVNCDPADVLAMFRGPWHWWARGISRDFRETSAGITDQILVPVWWYWVQVGMRIFPPVELPGGGWRLPAYLTGSFVGAASFDVMPAEGTSTVIVRGRFHGVEEHVPVIPRNYVSKSHLRAEAGTLPLPFGPGTGWRGLREKVERMEQR